MSYNRWLSSELYHHGVKEQKWGVKNGPPYPLSSDVSTGNRLIKSDDNKVLYGRYHKNPTTTNVRKLLSAPDTDSAKEKLKQRVANVPQNKKLKLFSDRDKSYTKRLAILKNNPNTTEDEIKEVEKLIVANERRWAAEYLRRLRKDINEDSLNLMREYLPKHKG